MKSIAREFRSAFKRRRLRSTGMADAVNRIIETNCVFVHVPKCGGKSVIRDIYNLGEHSYFGHAGIAFFESLLGPRRFRLSFKFTFVRDPALRCLSGFRFRQRGGFDLPGEGKVAEDLKDLSFDEFVLDGELSALIHNDIVFKSQKSFLTLPSGQLGIDRICRFESFNEELRRLPINLQNGDFTHINAAPDRYIPEISNDTYRKIKEVYEEDYHLIDSLA